MSPTVGPMMVAMLLSAGVCMMACKGEAPDAGAPAAMSPPSAETSRAVDVPSRVPSIDACAVLSRPEIEPLFGELKEGPSSGSGPSKEKRCRYSNTGGNWLEVSLYGSDRWSLQKGTYSEMSPKALPALGDEAFSIKRGTDSVVFVRKAGGVMELSCSCDLAKAEALAAKAVTKL
jgi:hypothetical protein